MSRTGTIGEARFQMLPRQFLLAPHAICFAPSTLPVTASVPSVRLSLRHRRSSRVISGRRPATLVVVSCASPAGASAAAADVKGTGRSTVIATISVQTTVGSLLTNIWKGRLLDHFSDLVGKSIQVELLSSELNPGAFQYCLLLVSRFKPFYIMFSSKNGAISKGTKVFGFYGRRITRFLVDASGMRSTGKLK